MSGITTLFTEAGGRFLHSEDTLKQKLQQIRAFVFDWDGVFTDGRKAENQQSSFNEVDSMGLNLLRFSYYTVHKELPLAVLMSGERNSTSFYFARRECFHRSYSKAANKADAARHLCENYHLKPHQIAFVFDDVLDLSLAGMCGLRFFIPRSNNPLFTNYVLKNNLADYVSAGTSGQYAIREICELIIALQSDYDYIVKQRVEFSDLYTEYLNKRQAVVPEFFIWEKGAINTLIPE